MRVAVNLVTFTERKKSEIMRFNGCFFIDLHSGKSHGFNNVSQSVTILLNKTLMKKKHCLLFHCYQNLVNNVCCKNWLRF